MVLFIRIFEKNANLELHSFLNRRSGVIAEYLHRHLVLRHRYDCLFVPVRVTKTDKPC